MPFPVPKRNPHFVRVPRDGRHVIRHLRRTRRGYFRASELVAAIDALDYSLGRVESPHKRAPRIARVAAGQRVRLGHDVRQILERIKISRNLRIEQALAKELRHALVKRIRVHTARSRNIRAVQRRTRATARWAGQTASRGARGAVTRTRHYTRTRRPRTGPGGMTYTTTVVSSRTERTARALPSSRPGPASRPAPAARTARTARPRTSRTPRG